MISVQRRRSRRRRRSSWSAPGRWPNSYGAADANWPWSPRCSRPAATSWSPATRRRRPRPRHRRGGAQRRGGQEHRVDGRQRRQRDRPGVDGAGAGRRRSSPASVTTAPARARRRDVPDSRRSRGRIDRHVPDAAAERGRVALRARSCGSGWPRSAAPWRRCGTRQRRRMPPRPARADGAAAAARQLAMVIVGAAAPFAPTVPRPGPAAAPGARQRPARPRRETEQAERAAAIGDRRELTPMRRVGRSMRRDRRVLAWTSVDRTPHSAPSICSSPEASPPRSARA